MSRSFLRSSRCARLARSGALAVGLLTTSVWATHSALSAPEPARPDRPLLAQHDDATPPAPTAPLAPRTTPERVREILATTAIRMDSLRTEWDHTADPARRRVLGRQIACAKLDREIALLQAQLDDLGRLGRGAGCDELAATLSALRAQRDPFATAEASDD